MGALTDLWKSERGLLAILLVVGATVLTALSHMTVAEWREYTLWMFGLYAGSKTVTGAVDLIMAPKRTEATAAAAATPVAEPTPLAESTPAPTPAEPSK